MFEPSSNPRASSNRLAVAVHVLGAAQHDAIMFGRENRQVEIREDPAGLDQGRDAALGAEWLARHGGVIGQPSLDHLTQELMRRQVALEQVAMGKFHHLAHGMGDHHTLEPVIDLGFARQGQEGGEARSGRQQPQRAAGLEVVGHQRAGGLAADQHGVARHHMLKARGQRPVLHLDGEELQLLVPGRARHGIGAHQRLAIHQQPDHGEFAGTEAEMRIPRAAEGEQPVGPVMDPGHALTEIGGGDGGGGRAGGIVHGAGFCCACGMRATGKRRALLRGCVPRAVVCP